MTVAITKIALVGGSIWVSPLIRNNREKNSPRTYEDKGGQCPDDSPKQTAREGGQQRGHLERHGGNSSSCMASSFSDRTERRNDSSEHIAGSLTIAGKLIARRIRLPYSPYATPSIVRAEMPVKQKALAPLLVVFGPAELLPQVLRDQLVYPFEDVGGFVARRPVGQGLGGGLACQDNGGGHARLPRPADVRVQPVARHNAVGGFEPCKVRNDVEHYGIWLAGVRLAPGAGARLDRGHYRRGVRLTPAAGKRAIAVRVRGNEPGPFVVPDRVKGCLQLAVIKGAVVAGDDVVYLLGPLRHLYPRLLQSVNERLLCDGEDGSVRVVL